MTRVSDVIAQLQSWYPEATADDWDAPGIVCGSLSDSISSVLLTVDVTSAVVDEAIETGASLIVSHHPYLLRGIKTLDESLAKGNVLSRAVRAGITIYAAHTNADIAEDGVSAALAAAIGLTDSRPLVGDSQTGHGRIGSIGTTSLGSLAQHLARVLPATATGIRVAGDFDQSVSTIALCAGAGDSFISSAISADADVYITSDLRHHPVQDAREHALLNANKPALIDISHWAAEYLWLETLESKLSQAFDGIRIAVSDLRTDPWDFTITQ
jgi:dinuclear metal center YbgI/SA1388 family protein